MKNPRRSELIDTRPMLALVERRLLIRLHLRTHSLKKQIAFIEAKIAREAARIFPVSAFRSPLSK
jgi:hypothetical protein